MTAAPEFVSIASLKKGNETRSINVRVTRIWDGINKKTNKLIKTNVNLLDDEDSHILATMLPLQREKFLPLIEEGNVYTVSNFSVVAAPTDWKSVRGDLAINFVFDTKIMSTKDDSAIPNYKFKFMPFPEIPSRVGAITQLFDIVGYLKSITELITVGKGLRKMDAILGDARGNETCLTLWEDIANSFMSKYSKQSSESLVIVVVTSIIVKQYMGNKSLALSPASKFYFNIDINEVRELRQHLQQENHADTSVQVLPAPIEETYEEKITRNRVNIAGIRGVLIPEGQETVMCICKATIHAIVDDMGWYYNACVQCLRKMKTSATTLYCDSCSGSPEIYKQRFKVLIHARDESGEAIFVLFNTEVEQLLGVSIDQVLHDHNKVETLASIPPLLRNIQGMTCIFQLKITSFNTKKGFEQYTVSRVFEQENIKLKNKLIVIDDDAKNDSIKEVSTLKRVKIEKD